MIGKILGRYRVVENIGRGGMGEVFLAEDTSLHRRVALKFLPPEMERDDEARKRFVREARSAAALDHPYICHINEVAEFEGRHFIAMEYVDGDALRARIAQSRLPLDETLRAGIEVAEALEAAHGKGIVHRDIKPENIMLTRTGHAKVMDFGLAKRMAGPAPGEAEPGGPTMTLLTQEGTTAGTLAYMSPEQLRGWEADARSDIWSLGVTLYEMASGARPFAGQSGFELSSAILNKPPMPLPAAVPAALGAVIGRCLEKDATKRYQKAQDLRAALEAVRAGTASTWTAWRYRLASRQWLAPAAVTTLLVAALAFALDLGGLRTTLTRGAGASGRPIKLAVLPFENLSGDPGQDFLSNGLTQDMISELGRLRTGKLAVIGFTSTMRYKNSEVPLEQIGHELGADHILGGSCRMERSRVRISAELIRLRDRSQLWTETYEREMSGILALQSEVARKVAGAMALRLLPGDQARLMKARDVVPEAYEAYHKGIQQRALLTKAGFDAAEFFFNIATDRDPDYAAPWAGLAGLWNSRMQLNMAPREEGLIKAKSAALKALALDDGEIEARRVLAGILTWSDWDWGAAERAWDRLFEIDPDNATALPGYAHFLLVTGREGEAVARIERAVEIDPHNIRTRSFHAVVLMHTRRYDEAIAMARKILEAQPRNEVARSALADSLFKKGLPEELMAWERERWADDPELTEALEQGRAEGGVAGAEKRAADILAARYGNPGGVTAYTLANYYARAGDAERVIEWLEKAYEEHNNNLPYMRTPVFDAVRDDPRFQDLVRRVGLL